MTSKLKAYDYAQAEYNLIKGDPETRYQIKMELMKKKARLDFFMSRFLDQYGEQLDMPKQKAFYDDKTNEYAKINRLLRIADAYA